MNRMVLIAAVAAWTPAALLAAPAVDDMVGTTPEDATAALKDLGCMVQTFTTEAGKIEAKCIDEAGKMSEVYIDPASGRITEIKAED